MFLLEICAKCVPVTRRTLLIVVNFDCSRRLRRMNAVKIRRSPVEVCISLRFKATLRGCSRRTNNTAKSLVCMLSNVKHIPAVVDYIVVMNCMYLTADCIKARP